MPCENTHTHTHTHTANSHFMKPISPLSVVYSCLGNSSQGTVCVNCLNICALMSLVLAPHTLIKVCGCRRTCAPTYLLLPIQGVSYGVVVCSRTAPPPAHQCTQQMKLIVGSAVIAMDFCFFWCIFNVPFSVHCVMKGDT